ncbi:MAG: anti-sigma factor [Actinomycetes bacterium]
MNDQSNMNSDSDDVSELIGAYVLDAVDDVERRRVERAAAADPLIAAEIDRLQAVADSLADPFEMAPPVHLWDSILSEVEETPVGRGGPTISGVDEITMRSSTSSRRFLLAAAAVVAVFVIGGAALVGLSRSSAPTDSIATMKSMALDAASKPGSRQGVLTDPANTMEVWVIVDAQGHGFVMTDPLPALPEGETYQLWSAANGTMVSLGMLGSNPTMSLVPIDGSVTELALTREPAKGSVSPTSNPMATGQLI